MEIIRLKKENYDELISLLNYVFTRHNKKEANFEKDLPKMCVCDDEHMQKHFGIFEDGKLVAAIGVYPLPTDVAGERLLFSTVGNVVTHPDYEGRGYMTALLNCAMSELERIGADASRLAGLRHRYNRYGYEMCGAVYSFAFTGKNRKNRFPDLGEDVILKKIESTDILMLKRARELQSSCKIAVERSEENDCFDIYSAMTAWQNIPYAAIKDGRMIGYLCANERGNVLAENYAESTKAMAEMICAWQKKCGGTVSFSLFPHDSENVRMFLSCAADMSVRSPSHFKIINWQGVISAFMKLKATYTDMPTGELKLGIKDYGVLRLYSDSTGVGCERTETDADIILDGLEASRYIFGPLPPEATADAGNIAHSWFPLPLSWNGQDRV